MGEVDSSVSRHKENPPDTLWFHSQITLVILLTVCHTTLTMLV